MAPQNADEKLPGTHPFAKSKPILGSSFYRELSHQDLVTTFNQSDKAWSETFVVHPVDFLFFFDGWGSCVGYTQKNEFQVDPEKFPFGDGASSEAQLLKGQVISCFMRALEQSKAS